MIDDILARRYARALFESARGEEILPEVEKDLSRLSEVLSKSEGLYLWSSPYLS